MNIRKTALVVGAGLGGMTTAYRLQQAGYKVSVFEKLAYPGGRIRTVRKGECFIDTGAMVMSSTYDQMLALIEELGLNDQLEVVGGHFAVSRDGETHLISLDNPAISILTSRLLSWKSKFLLVKLLFKLLPLRKHFNFYSLGGAAGYDDETLAKYCHRNFPSEVYDYLLNPMLKFLYLHSGNKGSSMELLWWMNAMGTRPSRSFKYGMNTLTDKLAELVDVQCNSEVVDVSEHKDGVQVNVVTDEGLQTLTVNRCVITTPAPVTHRIYKQVTSSQQAFLSSREYDKVTVVSFCTRTRPKPDVLMIEIPDTLNDELATVVFQHSVASTRAPADKGIVNAYFMQGWSERHIAEDDEAVMKAAQLVVRELVPGVDELDAYYVQRWEHTAALSEVGVCAKIQQFIDNTDPDSPIQVIGDYLAGASLNVAVTTANRVAARLST